MKLLLTFSACLLLSLNIRAQECDCKASFEWMVSTFEKNDAGFQYVIDKKGMEDYQKHNTLYREKVKNITTLNECQTQLYYWLTYFRPGHIAIVSKQQPGNNNSNTTVKPPSPDSIRQVYKGTRTVDMTQNQLLALLANEKNKNAVEGVWGNGTYTIGIVADENTPGKYAGFIIKADSVYWVPKQLKVELTANADQSFATDFYMRDHSKTDATAKVISDGGNLLLMKGDIWTRSSPGVVLTQRETGFLKFLSSRLPYVEKMDNKTVYLRIPSFAADQKKKIDSTLARYDKLIRSTPNLIIDIRNGTGGSDASYKKIIPYLYTGPIRSVNLQLRATELNAEGYERYAKQYEDDAENRNYCLQMAKKMREHLGAFINTSDEIASMDTLKVVMPYPKKVAIICNHGNGSTDEQFLLDARQSSKVKIFGRSTFGALDISNMNYIDFPDGKFQLGYCMSKSYRIPNFTIDGVGVQPDHFIDDGVKDTDWVEYTKNVLEN